MPMNTNVKNRKAIMCLLRFTGRGQRSDGHDSNVHLPQSGGALPLSYRRVKRRPGYGIRQPGRKPY